MSRLSYKKRRTDVIYGDSGEFKQDVDRRYIRYAKLLGIYY
jgi:hypothetical protein